MILANRVSTISLSPTVAVKQAADRLRKEGADIIDFGPGEPDFATPEDICEAAIDAIRAGFTHYTATAGTDELRDMVAARYNQMGDKFTRDNVIITCGAKHALFGLFTALFQDGDEVLILVPYWVSFPEGLRLVGARPQFVPTYQEDNFTPRIEEIESRISDRTKGIIINSPNNPSGAVYPRNLLQDLRRIALERNLYLISDETYEFFTYDKVHYESLAPLMKPEEHQLVVVSSFSKSFAMTGWRVGFCIGHSNLIRHLIAIQSHMTTNPCSISQVAAMEALNQPDLVKPMLEAYARRRKLVLESLKSIPGFKVNKPQGSFYVFPSVEAYLGKSGLENSVDFAKELLDKARVAVVPGAAFGMEGHVRISYATSEENLKEGFRRIKNFLLD